MCNANNVNNKIKILPIIDANQDQIVHRSNQDKSNTESGALHINTRNRFKKQKKNESKNGQLSRTYL